MPHVVRVLRIKRLTDIAATVAEANLSPQGRAATVVIAQIDVLIRMNG